MAISTTVILVCADAILAQALFADGKYKTVVASLLMMLVLMTPVEMFRGAKDIYETYVFTRDNEAYLYQCVANVERQVVLPMMVSGTKYSALYDLRYVAPDDPEDWPNNAMSKYYGIGAIRGIRPEYPLP